MRSTIGPVTLPPALAFFEMWVTLCNEAAMAATEEAYRFWTTPFLEPHHHPHEAAFQMEVPEPIEATGEHDLFA